MTAGLQAESSRTPAEVGVTEHRGERVPLDVMVRDESGAERRLGDFFRRGRPVVLIPSYYHCPRLCTYVFKAVQKAVAEVRASGLAPGRDFQVLSYSFDSREGYAEAKKRATSIRSLFGAQPLPEGAWQFLSGDAAAASRLMGSIGYRYKADGESDFSHAAAIVLLAPDGKITRYLYGIEYPEREFRLSLVEAANGTIGGATEQIMLYCFRYDPVEGRYTPFAWAFVRIGGAATLALVLALIFFLLRRERRAKGA
ncbi:MAG: SCO family protein [Leptospirales bacterium]|nr:SCO family protein [Leptospirales bacterium]